MDSFLLQFVMFAAACFVGWFLFYGLFRALQQSKLVSYWLAGAFTLALVSGLFITSGMANMFYYGQGENFIGGRNFLGLAPVGFLIALNFVATPALYFVDKTKAVTWGADSTRIPEFVLHFVSFVGGAIGAYFSQKIFRHKTSKRSFRIIFYLSVLSSLVIYYLAGRLAFSL